MNANIHIIDANKASIVMTSEVFKDKIPGSVVTVSTNAKDAIAFLVTKQGKDAPDLVVVDFDLPDADGVSLVKELRKTYKGPVFLTAFASDVVKHAVSEELFHYNDSCQWVAKPVRSDQLDKKIETFLIQRYRLGRRFDVEFLSLLVGKGEGRGKRAPKFDGRTTNISLGGAGVDLNIGGALKIGDELVLSMAVPAGQIEGAGPLDSLKDSLSAARAAESKSSKTPPSKTVNEAGKTTEKPLKGSKKAKTPPPVEIVPTAPAAKMTATKFQEYKIKATVAWLGHGGKKAGLTFNRISDQQRRQIESFLKGLAA
jgi:CheY-like chemotaxis protein